MFFFTLPWPSSSSTSTHPAHLLLNHKKMSLKEEGSGASSLRIVVFALEGIPGVGKTSVIEQLKEYCIMGENFSPQTPPLHPQSFTRELAWSMNYFTQIEKLLEPYYDEKTKRYIIKDIGMEEDVDEVKYVEEEECGKEKEKDTMNAGVGMGCILKPKATMKGGTALVIVSDRSPYSGGIFARSGAALIMRAVQEMEMNYEAIGVEFKRILLQSQNKTHTRDRYESPDPTAVVQAAEVLGEFDEQFCSMVSRRYGLLRDIWTYTIENEDGYLENTVETVRYIIEKEVFM